MSLPTPDGSAERRMMQAAPDLLAALKGLERIVTAFAATTRLGTTQVKRLEAARAAIAKAERPDTEAAAGAR
jgi:hypothetical protein